MTAREAVYWWLYDNVSCMAGARYNLWMAVKESGKSMGDIAKRLHIRVQHVWAAFDDEKSPMFSTFILISRAVNCRIEIDLVA